MIVQKDNRVVHRRTAQVIRGSLGFSWHNRILGRWVRIFSCSPRHQLTLSGMSLAAWLSATLMEHFYFRKGNFALYDIRVWNVPSQLPLGAAALGSCILSFALVIPSMNQVLYTGNIARKTGDIGFEVATVVTALLYVPLRHLEKRWRGV